MKKILFITGICFCYIIIIYLTYCAVAKVHNIHDPAYAKRVVITTFFANLFLFAGSIYLILKLKGLPKQK
ncbi:MAG: hypothetical protein E3K37_03705 [Candidatus Kuenenia sp.]|nr:hypothetical protein [Candidatus Kuenenia hertensis]